MKPNRVSRSTDIEPACENSPVIFDYQSLLETIAMSRFYAPACVSQRSEELQQIRAQPTLSDAKAARSCMTQTILAHGGEESGGPTSALPEHWRKHSVLTCARVTCPKIFSRSSAANRSAVKLCCADHLTLSALIWTHGDMLTSHLRNCCTKTM